MPIQTVGTPEVVLQLISEFQGLNGHRPTPDKLWAQIVSFVKEDNRGSAFCSYRLGRMDPEDPSPQFLGDIAELIKYRFVELRGDGKLELTPVGRCLTFARVLPPSLVPLAQRVASSGNE